MKYQNAFHIMTYNLADGNFEDEELPFDYHCLYILENGKDAYIGETNDPKRRLKEHRVNSIRNKNRKYIFTRIHIISGFLSEETPTKHYENLLIKLMKADNRFHIINRNEGERPHYARKNIFELYFDKLWLQLEKKGLVKTRKFELVIGSSIYKYSPYTILTKEQQNTLTSIVHTIDSEETQPHAPGFKTRPILIEGDAGTGKTVVATSLFYYLKSEQRYKDKKIALVYANPATRKEIQEVFKNIEGLSEKDVITPLNITKQHYDIVICDETQKLRQGKNLGKYYIHFKQGNAQLNLDNTSDELDWILTNSTCQVLFYDAKQSTCPSDISAQRFKDKLYEKKRGIRPIELKEQMRIQAGRTYVSYIYNILYQEATKAESFKNYEFKLFSSFSGMHTRLLEKEKETGLCRFCAGYAWEWKKGNDDALADIVIDGVPLYWNSQTAGWKSNPKAKNEMGSIYTLPGLDLNYAGIVIGPELYYDKDDHTLKIDKNNFFDDKVKKNVSDAELKIYILNTYAVFFTRGIKGTYVYVCDENLREYFKQYIPFVEE